MLLSKVLPANNVAFFRFDHRGCGDSQGSFIKDTSIEKRARDFCAAVGHVLEMGVTSNRIALFGSSMGGATCINAWQDLEHAGFKIQGCCFVRVPREHPDHKKDSPGRKRQTPCPFCRFF